MFVLCYTAKGTNFSIVFQTYAATGFGMSCLVFPSEKAARDRAAALHMANRNAYDYYLGELTMAAAVTPPPPLEFKKIG
jgi:hypothetical protein